MVLIGLRICFMRQRLSIMRKRIRVQWLGRTSTPNWLFKRNATTLWFLIANRTIWCFRWAGPEFPRKPKWKIMCTRWSRRSTNLLTTKIVASICRLAFSGITLKRITGDGLKFTFCRMASNLNLLPNRSWRCPRPLNSATSSSLRFSILYLLMITRNTLFISNPIWRSGVPLAIRSYFDASMTSKIFTTNCTNIWILMM